MLYLHLFYVSLEWRTSYVSCSFFPQMCSRIYLLFSLESPFSIYFLFKPLQFYFPCFTISLFMKRTVIFSFSTAIIFVAAIPICSSTAAAVIVILLSLWSFFHLIVTFENSFYSLNHCVHLFCPSLASCFDLNHFLCRCPLSYNPIFSFPLGDFHLELSHRTKLTT